MTSTAIPTLAKLIRRTAQLRRDLLALMKQFPEEDLELGEQDFCPPSESSLAESIREAVRPEAAETNRCRRMD